MGYVVVGIDGSDASREALREAHRQAQWRGDTLVVVHVVDLPLYGSAEIGMFARRSLREAGLELMTNEVEWLRTTVGGGFGCPVESEIHQGHAGVELRKVAEGRTGKRDAPADLVVLGSRGLGGFRGALLGSISTYVLHHLSCPVLVIPETTANNDQSNAAV